MDEAADLAWSDGTYGTVSDVRIRAVAFDIGGVLKQVGRISDFEATWQERLGMTQAEFGQALASVRYNLVRDLGGGGMGEVYLVRHVDTGRAAGRCRTLARVRATSVVHLGYFIFPEGSFPAAVGCAATRPAAQSRVAWLRLRVLNEPASSGSGAAADPVGPIGRRTGEPTCGASYD
jgi:hypothetical protein